MVDVSVDCEWAINFLLWRNRQDGRGTRFRLYVMHHIVS